MINEESVKKHFEKMGARVKIRKDSKPVRWNGRVISTPDPFLVDVRSDRKGEFFDFVINPETLDSMQVLDLQSKDRHLLFQIITPGRRSRRGRAAPEFVETQKFLMGHDERHWFVCGVNNTVSTVDGAKQSLKPDPVVESQRSKRVRKKNRHKRKNRGFKRQGEWFFVPAPDLEVSEKLIMRNEPIQRDVRSKPHTVQELYRRNGRTVMVHRRFAPTGMSLTRWNRWVVENPDKGPRYHVWERRTTTRELYARGTVRHADHKTIKLQGWHRIHSNSETASSSVTFLD